MLIGYSFVDFENLYSVLFQLLFVESLHVFFSALNFLLVSWSLWNTFKEDITKIMTSHETKFENGFNFLSIITLACGSKSGIYAFLHCVLDSP